jgi:TIR domain
MKTLPSWHEAPSDGKETDDVGGGELEVDPRAPLFFLSHASGKKARNPQNVMRLFDDLSAHVSELVGLPAGSDPGFMDRTLNGGERWTSELLEAAGTCQVLVSLISPAYVRSKWCGMEWDAFSRRKIVRRADGEPDFETGIVPVIWLPMESSTLPPAVRGVQWFSPQRLPDPAVSAQYHQEGMYGLLSMNLDQAYRAVVWRLAQRVVAIYHSHWVEPLIPAGADALRNVFGRGAA